MARWWIAAGCCIATGALAQTITLEQKAACARYSANTARLAENMTGTYQAIQPGIFAKLADLLPPEAAAAARRADIVEKNAIPAGRAYADAVEDLAVQMKRCAR